MRVWKDDISGEMYLNWVHGRYKRPAVGSSLQTSGRIKE